MFNRSNVDDDMIFERNPNFRIGYYLTSNGFWPDIE